MAYNEKLKERRISKFTDVPFEDMSTTTRNLFKKWGHKRDEIINWQRGKTFRRLKEDRKRLRQENLMRITVSVWYNGKLHTY